MNSMHDALTEALEHPIAESPSRSKSGGRTRKPRQTSLESTAASDYLMWGVLGSIAGSLLVYGAYRWRNG